MMVRALAYRRITAVVPCFPYARQAETPYKTKDAASSTAGPQYDSWQARPGTLVANMVLRRRLVKTWCRTTTNRVST